MPCQWMYYPTTVPFAESFFVPPQSRFPWAPRWHFASSTSSTPLICLGAYQYLAPSPLRFAACLLETPRTWLCPPRSPKPSPSPSSPPSIHWGSRIQVNAADCKPAQARPLPLLKQASLQNAQCKNNSALKLLWGSLFALLPNRVSIDVCSCMSSLPRLPRLIPDANASLVSRTRDHAAT
ncbi:hypothetical protein LZ30DRAFT_50043 [Colletotrichum cereale]|nr:hypothetical protein LZ30DRAFT_50043 [Colletotrichum cereale]